MRLYQEDRDPAPKLQQLANKTRDALKDAAGPLVADLIRYTIATKFSSDPRYLQRRTGRSARYVAESAKVEVSRNRVRASFGASVPWVRAHETGFKGRVHVPRHTRLGRPVRAHERMLNLQARRMFHDVLMERRESVRSVAERALTSALDEVAR